MYLLAQKSLKQIEQLIEIKLIQEEIKDDDSLSESEKRDRIQTSEDKLTNLISNFSLDELKVIYAIVSIGTHERGYRHHTYNGDIEIIELEIAETYEELLTKYTKYIKFYSKSELEEYILRYTRILAALQEGLTILNLK